MPEPEKKFQEKRMDRGRPSKNSVGKENDFSKALCQDGKRRTLKKGEKRGENNCQIYGRKKKRGTKPILSLSSKRAVKSREKCPSVGVKQKGKAANRLPSKLKKEKTKGLAEEWGIKHSKTARSAGRREGPTLTPVS